MLPSRPRERLLERVGCFWQRGRAGLIEQTLLDASVGVDAAVRQEGPMGAMFVHTLPFNVGEDGFFSIDARLGENLAARRDDEALAPEFDPIATGWRFVADSRRCIQFFVDCGLRESAVAYCGTTLKAFLPRGPNRRDMAKKSR